MTPAYGGQTCCDPFSLPSHESQGSNSGHWACDRCLYQLGISRAPDWQLNALLSALDSLCLPRLQPCVLPAPNHTQARLLCSLPLLQELVSARISPLSPPFPQPRNTARFFSCLEKSSLGLERWLAALTALPEDPGLIPSTHTEAHKICNSNFRGTDSHHWPPGALVTHIMHRHS